MCHIFCIHSSVDGHLAYFHVLAIVNSAVMDRWVHVSFWIMFFSPDICPGVGLLDHIIIPFLVLWGTSILFSTVAAPTSIATNNVGVAFTSSLAFVVCRLLNYGDSNQCEMVLIVILKNLIIYISSPISPIGELVLQVLQFYQLSKPSSILTYNINVYLLAALAIALSNVHYYYIYDNALPSELETP